MRMHCLSDLGRSAIVNCNAGLLFVFGLVEYAGARPIFEGMNIL